MRRTLIIIGVVVAVVAVAFAVVRVNAPKGGPASIDSEPSEAGSAQVSSSTGESKTETPRTATESQSSGREPSASRPASSAVSETQNKNTPARDGQPLRRITVPPSGTLAAVSPKQETENATYTLVFKPFGFGPHTLGSETLAVLVVECTPSGTQPGHQDYASAHLLLKPERGILPKVAEGGTYEGQVVFRTSKLGLVAHLESAKRKGK